MSRFEYNIVCTSLLLMAACGGHQHAVPVPDAGTAPPNASNDAGEPKQPEQPGEQPKQPSQPEKPTTPTKPGEGSGRVEFPLRISTNHRYLVDQRGQAFLINQASSWGLVQSLSTEDAGAYLDLLAQRGFNAVMVSVISNDKRMAGDPPAWQGIEPFLSQWDFSTPNPAYFAHADAVIRLAQQHSMLVELVPCYLGFASDPTQGWADELVDSGNNLDTSRAYGRFLGDRYKSFDNIVWVAGGDNLPPAGSELEQRLKAIVEGIRERDPAHLWTAHWSSGDTGVMASENPAFASMMDLNGYYAFDYDLTYERDLDTYASQPTKPLFHLDMSYETEEGGTPSNIRRKAYDALLSGAAGSSFNAGPDWYLFHNWKNMDTQGTRETKYWYQLFTSRPWQNLVPDRDHRVLVSGYGEYGTVDYVSAARTEQADLLIAYLPNGGEVTVDLSALQAERTHSYWYDPTQGTARDLGRADARGEQQFRAPSSGSWVLVVEDDARGWPAPGSDPTVR
jgi:hypothetical protein